MKRIKIGLTKQGRMFNLPVPRFLYRWLRKHVEVHEPIGIQDEVTLELIRDGKVIDRRHLKGNIICNTGKAAVAARVGGIAEDAFDYIAVGTGTTAAAATDTTLEAEITTGGLERAQVTPTRVTTTVTNDTLQLVKTWTASAAHAVTEYGTLNAAAAGDLLARKVFAVVNVADGDQLKLTAKYPITAA